MMRDRRKYYELVPRRLQQQTIETSEAVDPRKIKYPCYLFLDQASNTGYSLWDSESRLVLSGELSRGSDMSIRDFGFGLAEWVKGLIEEYKVDTVFHEEVYDSANMLTTEVLMYIKHKIQDIAHTNKEVNIMGLDHMAWKVQLAKPEKFVKSKDHKKQVQDLVEGVFPLITIYSENQSDAIGMGIAIMVKQKRKWNIFNVTRYNKKLPVWDVISDADVELTDVEGLVKTLRKPFRTAFEVGGIYEVPLDTRRRIDDGFKRFLSHKDSLVYTRIPKNYKYWGVMLLQHGIKPSDLTSEDQSFIALCCRKKRL